MAKNKKTINKPEEYVLFFKELRTNKLFCNDCYNEEVATHKNPRWKDDWSINILNPGKTFRCDACGHQIFENKEDHKRIAEETSKRTIEQFERFGRMLVKSKDTKGLEILLEQIEGTIKFWTMLEAKAKKLKRVGVMKGLFASYARQKHIEAIKRGLAARRAKINK